MSTPTVSAPPTAPTPAPASAPAKARPGELRAQVAQVLANDPGTGYTVTALVSLLGNSGGAIGNACQTLVTEGGGPTPGHQAPHLRRHRDHRRRRAESRDHPAGHPLFRPAVAGYDDTRPRPARQTGPDHPPDGQVYQPRALADMPDVEALRRLREANVPALLYGPPGTGKTSPDRGGLPRPDHRRRRRRHHGRRPDRRVHPEPGGHLRVHLRAAGHAPCRKAAPCSSTTPP